MPFAVNHAQHRKSIMFTLMVLSDGNFVRHASFETVEEGVYHLTANRCNDVTCYLADTDGFVVPSVELNRASLCLMRHGLQAIKEGTPDGVKR